MGKLTLKVFILISGIILFQSSTIHFAFALDERFLREVFQNQNQDNFSELVQKNKKYNWKWNSPIYAFDFNDDFEEDFLQLNKIDGLDQINIISSKGNLVFQYTFTNSGLQSGVTKIEKYNLDQNNVLILIYYHEGENKIENAHSSGRLYFLTFEKKIFNQLPLSKKETFLGDGDLKGPINIFKGPYFYSSQNIFPKHFHTRSMKVNCHDIDNDGIRDLKVSFRSINRVYLYRGRGIWRSL